MQCTGHSEDVYFGLWEIIVSALALVKQRVITPCSPKFVFVVIPKVAFSKLALKIFVFISI